MEKNLLKVRMIVLVLLCASYALTGYAQEEAKGKPNVFIDYFWRPSNVSFSWAENLRNSVIEGINKTGRVELTDVDSNDALAVEKARREADNVSAGDDMERLKVMTSEGANFLIQGRISSMVTDIKKTDDGNYYYTATCAYTLKVINPSNGKLVGTKTFKHGAGITDSAIGDTEEEAISKVCVYAVKAVRELVDEAFKIQGTILEVSAAKKDEAKEVYISLGSDNGVAEGAYFGVYMTREVAGRISRKEIGQLKVKAVEGGDISLCEVKKGGKEIKAAIDGGQSIVINTIQKPQTLFEKAAGAVNSL